MGVVVCYATYPYLTLYRLGLAMRAGNATALAGLVDWPSVREGIKEDMCDVVLDHPGDTKANSRLLPFGASFMRGLTSGAIDHVVTPEGLVAAVQQAPSAPRVPPPRGAAVQVKWAFFETPITFDVTLIVAGQAQPIRLQLGLRNASWQVRRVWLPDELLEANART
jgi:hypothetical protein